MSMPDKWEYPWFAAWDLGFHCVALAHVDPAFAKYQLILLCREWFQHPNGALPAYEWDFGDVNPPVQAWAALEVFAIDGATRPRLPQPRVRQAARQLHVVGEPRGRATATTCSRAASSASTTSARSTARTCPVGRHARAVRRHRLDGVLRAGHGVDRGDPATGPGSGRRPTSCIKFLEHFAAIREAMDDLGVWDEADGLFYDKLVTPDGVEVPVKVRSMVGIIPLLAAVVVDEDGARPGRDASASSSPGCSTPRAWATASGSPRAGLLRGEPGDQRLLLGVVGVEQLAAAVRASSSTRTSSCRRTACGPCPPTTASIPTSSTSRACRRRSTTSRPSRRRRCSAATRTGGVRSGSRSTTSSSPRSSATTASSATS